MQSPTTRRQTIAVHFWKVYGAEQNQPRKVGIKMNAKQVDQLIAELRKQGFSWEDIDRKIRNVNA